MRAKSVLLRVLIYGGVLALAIAVVGGFVGFSVAGASGLVSALVGTGMAVLFLAITVVSILLVMRLPLAVLAGVVVGAWLVKFVLFIILIAVLRDQPWVEPMVLFVSVVVAVVGTLVVDVVTIVTSRLPYVDTALPEQEGTAPDAGPDSV